MRLEEREMWKQSSGKGRFLIRPFFQQLRIVDMLRSMHRETGPNLKILLPSRNSSRFLLDLITHINEARKAEEPRSNWIATS